MTNYIRHGQNRQPERQSDADKPNTEVWKCGRQNGPAAAPENQPKRAEELGTSSSSQRHHNSSFSLVLPIMNHRRSPVLEQPHNGAVSKLKGIRQVSPSTTLHLAQLASRKQGRSSPGPALWRRARIRSRAYEPTGPRAEGSPFGRHHRPRYQQPQRARRGAAEPLGSAARRTGSDP